MGKIRVNQAQLNKIKSAIAASFDATVEAQSQAFDEAITAEEYPWPRETRRRNRDIVGSPRDIVDTGKLLDSKVVARSSTANAAEFTWETDYAIVVHEGATLQSGEELPARRWTEVGVEICQPQQVFEREMRRRL